MNISKSLLLVMLITFAGSVSSHAWWANRNDWGAAQGGGGFSSFTAWDDGGNFRSDWSGVWRHSWAYIILYPSAVEGWNFGGNNFRWLSIWAVHTLMLDAGLIQVFGITGTATTFGILH